MIDIFKLLRQNLQHKSAYVQDPHFLPLNRNVRTCACVPSSNTWEMVFPKWVTVIISL